MMDKVSVIMPCYNDGQYMEQAIESVKEQTYQNIELIVIDDGSDDEHTLKVLEKIGKEENIVILHTDHIRPAGARNYGIQHASGKYILPVDSDDMIDKTYVEKCVKVLEADKSIGVVYCFAELFGEKKGKWELPPYSLEHMLIDNIVFVTAMFRKEDWEQVGGFDVSMDEGMEDYAFWLSILELEKTIYQIPEVLFHYRIKKESRTSQFLDDMEKTKEIYRKIYFNHQKFYETHAQEYALVLRDALIEQIYVRRKYERRFEKLKKIKKVPMIRSLVRKIFGERD